MGPDDPLRLALVNVAEASARALEAAQAVSGVVSSGAISKIAARAATAADGHAAALVRKSVLRNVILLSAAWVASLVLACGVTVWADSSSRILAVCRAGVVSTDKASGRRYCTNTEWLD